MITIQKTPTELFQELKDKKKQTTEEELHEFYINALILAAKYKKTGQARGAQKLDFFIKNYEREKKLLGYGIHTYIYRSDVKYYIDHVSSSDHVGIIELKYYPREIPDEIASEIEKFKKEDLFDEYYVLFTDYTDELEEDVNNAREKENDPILFGCYRDTSSETFNEKFYYLADWEDEYCDLTLERMVNEVSKKNKEKIDHLIANPKSLEELKTSLNDLKEVNKHQMNVSGNLISSIQIVPGNSNTLTQPITYISADNQPKKKRTHFFANIRSVFSRGK